MTDTSPNDAGQLTGLKIMVVDDSKTIRKTAEAMLLREGAEVILVVDGFEALAAAVRERPDIILIDILMPNLDGYQTCALIKNNRNFASTPIIMLSSKDTLFDRIKGTVSGADMYLTKPFTRNELFRALSQYTNLGDHV